MANKQHLEWLKEGVGAWNERRARNPFTPDLREANLRWANLRGADLIKANLRGANLRWANLRRANLRGANLFEVDLREADLIGADLFEANLFEADLRGADLRGANLKGADLRRADLRGADLFEANLRGANLIEADVKSVKRHSSTNNENEWRFTDFTTTIDLSQEQLDRMLGDSGTLIPARLERPSYWPILEENDDDFQPDEEDEVELVPPKLAAEQAYTRRSYVFLSYSHDDAERVGDLHKFLKTQELPIWWDQDINGGAWRDEVAERLADAAAVLTVWTDNSVKSKAVREEADSAQRRNCLVHVRLDEAKLPFGFSETQYFDLKAWDGTAHDPQMRKVLQALRDLLDPPSKEVKTARLDQASTLGAVAHNGKMRLEDTPLNTLPAKINPPDLEARLEAQIDLASDIVTDIQSQRYNVPSELEHRVARYGEKAEQEQAKLTAPEETKLNWYRLENAMQIIRNCMEENECENWQDQFLQNCVLLDTRHRELENLIRPEQIPLDAPEAPPPAPQAHLNELSDDLSEELQSVAIETREAEAVDEVFVEASAESFKEALEELQESIQDYRRDDLPVSDESKARKASWLRRNLTKVAGTVASVIGVLSTGVTINLLTSPQAGETLLLQLNKLLDLLLKLF